MKLLSSLLLLCSSLLAATYTVSTATFTDSQNRSSLYRIGIPDGYDTSTPKGILIFFHGNNSGTQQKMVDDWYNYVQNKADARNLIPIVFTSPETRADGVTRQWSEDLDPTLLDEFLKGNAQNKITIDNKKVFLWGASQGTCFINAFLMAKGDSYEGGGLGNCGCFNSLNKAWAPKQSFIDNFRFYILATTGDFLHQPSTNGYEYYNYTVGLKHIRGDLSRSGAHCTAPESAADTALDWITQKITLPEDPHKIHWQRISPKDSITALRLSNSNELLISVNPETGTPAVYLSSDQGDTWQEKVAITDPILDMEILGESTFLLTSKAMLEYDKSFNLVSTENVSFEQFKKTDSLTLYRLSTTNGVEITTDSGENWSKIHSNVSLAETGRDFYDSTQSEIAVSPWNNSFYHIDENGDKTDIVLPGSLKNTIFSKQDNHLLVFGYVSNFKAELHLSKDNGANWDKINLPTADSVAYTGYGASLLPDKSIVSYGGTGYHSTDQGASWTPLVNFSRMYHPRWLQDKDGILYAADINGGVFRYDNWATLKQRPKHTDGTVTVALQQNPNTFSWKIQGQELSIQTEEWIQVESISANGSRISLFKGEGWGNVTLDIPQNSIAIQATTNSGLHSVLRKRQ